MSFMKRALARLHMAAGDTSSAPADRKASAIAPLVAMQWQGQAVWSPRDYGTFAREGFMQNAVVYRAVRMIADAAASIPTRLYAGADEMSDHPMLSLLSSPNGRQCLPN